MAQLRGTVVTLLVFILVISYTSAESKCEVPDHFRGQFFSIEQGVELNTHITPGELENEVYNAECQEVIQIDNPNNADNRFDARILYYSEESDCAQCWELLYRTENIVQYRISSCISTGGSIPSLTDVCNDISPGTEPFTLFRTNLEVVNCKSTFEGVFQFSYEVNYGGGGVCDNPNSQIVACQEPGSRYVDNQVFNMEFRRCPEVSSSVNDKIRFQCMGKWRDDEGRVWAAVANLGKDIFRERFRCLLTRDDQQLGDNTRRYTMSRWAQCDTLKSPYDGDIRLVLLPVVYGNQMVEPQCKFPRNFTGTWFTTGEFDTDITINATHIYFKTKIDQYTYRETYFTCQQSIDSRTLVTAVTVGKCEVDFICFDFVPRHHNIIRSRMSKPYRLTPTELFTPDFLIRKFRQACSWTSFTIDREERDWTYNVFVLNPPSPVDCPIAGRYQFQMIGTPSEFYKTRVEGITVRPRHQIDCRNHTTEMKSCAENTKKILIDVDYCATVDHTGRPIGEYDEPDNELSCVGFWMEDQRSYMITYDEEDAVSYFRCWVYERLDWRDLRASRSTRATCSRNQLASSHTPEEGASLALILHESERIDDNCPQRFLDGHDPYKTELKVYVLGGATSLSFNLFITILTSFTVMALELN